jgi:cysteine desulfurase
MINMLTDNYGNPESLHKKGDEAKYVLERSRANVAASLSCSPDEIYFTGSGTESNNIAIFGAAQALKRNGKRIITTAIEHPSVSEPMDSLEEQGFEIVRLPVSIEGKIKEADLLRAVTSQTILISIMLVNNEVGSIQPVRTARTAVSRLGSRALIHCDAVQGYGKLPLSPASLGADLISVSSHKIHGPKGVGALYIKKGSRIIPPMLGGGQESGIRSGTHAMPAIAGFGAAVGELTSYNIKYENFILMRDSFVRKILSLGGVYINSPPDALPFILNISVPGIPSEVMRNELSNKGIYVSSGSACSKGHRSKVLTRMGIPNPRIDSALRISFSRYTTKEELDYLTQQMVEIINRIRRMR